jgi:hypothetical protein
MALPKGPLLAAIFVLRSMPGLDNASLLLTKGELPLQAISEVMVCS